MQNLHCKYKIILFTGFLAALFLQQAQGQVADDPSNCGSELVDPRDSTRYKTVEIGSQCWMAENLNIGTRISLVKDQRDNAILEKYCYDNKDDNCKKYGGLYQWDETMQYAKEERVQGICPPGWHVPSDEEWCNLVTYLDSTVNCGIFGATGNNLGQLKSPGTIESKTGLWYFPNEGAMDESAFNALPAGTRSIYSKFFYLGHHGYFWTSTEDNSLNAWFWYLKYSNNGIYRESYFKKSGYSVRCIRE